MPVVQVVGVWRQCMEKGPQTLIYSLACMLAQARPSPHAPARRGGALAPVQTPRGVRGDGDE